MKRKLIIKISIIASLALLAIGGIITIIICSNNKKIDIGFHTILESKAYTYEEGRRMTFNVYSDTYSTLLKDTKNNKYILKLNTLTYELENVSVERYKSEDYTLIKISADLPYTSKTISSDSAKLLIITAKYQLSLRLGCLSIFNHDEHELLGVDSYYGTYSIVDGQKVLVGINIKFSKKYLKMRDLKIGEFAYGNLGQAFISNNMPHEINISDYLPTYNIYRVERSADVDVSNDTYFIPLNYTTIGTIRESYLTIILDDKKYYLDDFSFMTNELSYKDYKDKMKDGEFI